MAKPNPTIAGTCSGCEHPTANGHPVLHGVEWQDLPAGSLLCPACFAARGENLHKPAARNEARAAEQRSIDQRPPAGPTSPGQLSNARITARNGGIPHRFIDSIGGDSSNYR